MQTAFPQGFGSSVAQAGVGAGFGTGTYPNIPGVALHQASQLSYPNAFNNNTTSRFQMAANSIWKMSVLDDSEWLTSRILPKRKVDGTAVMFQETRMHPTLMEPNPEWSQAKLVSLSRRQKITRLNRWGLQLEIEINMAEDPYGQQAFAIYVETIQRAFEDTLAVDVIAELFNCNLDADRKMLQQNIYRGKSAWDAMQTEILYYHALQKLKNPLEMIDAKISEEMGYLRGKFNTIILPSQARAYVKTAKNQYLDYKLAGPAGPALARSDIHENARAGAYPGLGESIEVYSIKRTHAMSELTGGNDIMSTERTIGEYYVMQSSLEWDDARWTPECQAIKIYDEERGDYKLLRMDEVIAGSQTFGSDGKVRDLGSLPGAYNRLDDNSIDDMFTNQVSKKPVKIFAEIHGKYLSAEERVRWARGFIKRESGHGADSLKDLHAKLVSVLAKEAISPGPQNYLTNAKDIIGQIIGNLVRCFPTAIYLSPSASPIGATASAEAAFLYNVMLPEYIPAFEVDVSGRNVAGSVAASASLLFAQIFKDATEAQKAADSIDANKATPANLASDIARVRRAVKIYSLFTVKPEDVQKPTWDEAQDDVFLTTQTANFNKVNGNLVTAQKVEAKANLIVARIDSKWDSSNANKYTPKKDFFYSPAALEKVYNEWALDETRIPGVIPANPYFPAVPVTFDVLKDYVTGKQHYRSPNIGHAYSPATPHILSLISAHVQSLKEAEDYGHSEHLESHAHIAAHGSSVLHEMIARAKQASIGAGMTPVLMAPAASAEELEILTSHSTTEMDKQIASLATPLERIVASLFNQSEVSLETLHRFSVCGLPIPFAALVFRPDITHITASAIAVWRGEETGYTAVGKPLWTYAMNMGSQSQGGHFSVYSRAIVTAPQNVYVVPSIMITGYVRGNSCAWIDRERRQRGEIPSARESLYAVLIPPVSCSRDIRPVISISGRISDVPYFQEAGVMAEDPFPQALRFVKTFGTYEDNIVNANDDNGIMPANLVCLPGQCLLQTDKGFTEMRPGMGHLGDTNGPNAKQVRSSALLSYEKDTGAINRYV